MWVHDRRNKSCKCDGRVSWILPKLSELTAGKQSRNWCAYKVRTSNCGCWKSGEETSYSATTERTPSTNPRRKVTVCPVMFKIVIGKSSSGTEITDKISTWGWHTGSNTAKSASDRNLEFKRKEKFTPEWGLILTLLDNATVLTVCARTLWPSDKLTGITQSPTVKDFTDSLISSLN